MTTEATGEGWDAYMRPARGEPTDEMGNLAQGWIDIGGNCAMHEDAFEEMCADDAADDRPDLVGVTDAMPNTGIDSPEYVAWASANIMLWGVNDLNPIPPVLSGPTNT